MTSITKLTLAAAALFTSVTALAAPLEADLVEVVPTGIPAGANLRLGWHHSDRGLAHVSVGAATGLALGTGGLRLHGQGGYDVYLLGEVEERSGLYVGGRAGMSEWMGADDLNQSNLYGGGLLGVRQNADSGLSFNAAVGGVARYYHSGGGYSLYSGDTLDLLPLPYGEVSIGKSF